MVLCYSSCSKLTEEVKPTSHYKAECASSSLSQHWLGAGQEHVTWALLIRCTCTDSNAEKQGLCESSQMTHRQWQPPHAAPRSSYNRSCSSIQLEIAVLEARSVPESKSNDVHRTSSEPDSGGSSEPGPSGDSWVTQYFLIHFVSISINQSKFLLLA